MKPRIPDISVSINQEMWQTIEDFGQHFSQVIKTKVDKLLTDRCDTWRNAGSLTRARKTQAGWSQDIWKTANEQLCIRRQLAQDCKTVNIFLCFCMCWHGVALFCHLPVNQSAYSFINIVFNSWVGFSVNSWHLRALMIVIHRAMAIN